MTPFQAISTAIAAQVGTGNITGAATALISGGPGAIFWMWLSAFFGMSTIYAEATLAQTYKTTDEEGHVTGGPVYYIRQAFKGHFRKSSRRFIRSIHHSRAGFHGNYGTVNSISAAFTEAFTARNISFSPLIIGVLLAVFAFFIFVGGTKRLSAVVEKVVPFMAVIYIIGKYSSSDYECVSYSLRIQADFRMCIQSAEYAGRRSRHHNSAGHPLRCCKRTILQRSRYGFHTACPCKSHRKIPS